MAHFARANQGEFAAELHSWARRFEQAGRGPGRDILAAIGSQVAASTEQRIEQQVDVNGHPLAPVSPAYALWKQYGTTSGDLAMRRAGQLADIEREGAFLVDAETTYKRRQAVIRKWRRGTGKAGRRGGFGSQIWVYSGTSKESIVTRVLGPRAVAVVINTPYSGYVNEGTEHMPERRILGLSADDKRIIIRLLERGLVQALTGARVAGG